MRGEASDEELMLRYGRGDARAFELLYRRHRSLVPVLLRQLGNGGVGRRIVQDLWMRVVNSAGAIRPGKFLLGIRHRPQSLMDFYRANGGPRS